MVNVLILGSSGDRKIFTTLRGILSRFFTVSSVSAHHELTLAEKPDFFLFEGEAARTGEAKNTILVCKNSFLGHAHAVGHSLPQAAVLGTENVAAANYIGSCSIDAVTCGMSCRDTITFSSFEEERAVLCVQRSIPTLDGRIVEPGDFPVTLSHQFDGYTLMACAAVLLLSGCGKLLDGLVF